MFVSVKIHFILFKAFENQRQYKTNHETYKITENQNIYLLPKKYYYYYDNFMT